MLGRFLFWVRERLLPIVPEPGEHSRTVAVDDKWTISQERAFMEDLVYKRLTLFLAVTGVLVTAAYNLRDHLGYSIALLVCGTALSWALQQTVHRAQLKLDVILKLLFQQHDHPVGYINDEVGDAGRVKLVGYLVPTSICVMLSALTLVEIVAVAINPGLLKVPPPSDPPASIVSLRLG